MVISFDMAEVQHAEPPKKPAEPTASEMSPQAKTQTPSAFDRRSGVRTHIQ